VKLTPSGAHAFSDSVYGYSAPASLTVTVRNSGNNATGALTVALSSNTWLDDLSVSADLTTSGLAQSAADSFTVTPKAGLAAGIYTATLTVTGSNSISASLALSFTVAKREISIASVFTTPKADSVTVDSVWFAGLVAGETLTRNTDYTDSAVFGCIRPSVGRDVMAYISLKSDGATAKNYALKSGASPHTRNDPSILNTGKRVFLVVGMENWLYSDVLAFLLNEELKRKGGVDVTRNSAVQQAVRNLRRCVGVNLANTNAAACLAPCKLLKWSVANGISQVYLVRAVRQPNHGSYTFSVELISASGQRLCSSCTAPGDAAAHLNQAAWELAKSLKSSGCTAIPAQCCE
jgi:hypothetical protein